MNISPAISIYKKCCVPSLVRELRYHMQHGQKTVAKMVNFMLCILYHNTNKHRMGKIIAPSHPFPHTHTHKRASQEARGHDLSRKTTVWETETPGKKGTCQASESLEILSPNPWAGLEVTRSTKRQCLAQDHRQDNRGVGGPVI